MRLTKTIYVSLLTSCVLLSYSCTEKKNELKENSLSCFNDTIIKFKHDLLIFNLLDKEIIFNNSEIIFKSSKKEYLLGFKIDTEGKSLSIKPPLNLKSNDTILLKVNNTKKYIISDFHNSPDYGGNKFIGCVLKQCKVNNKTVTLNSSMYLDLE